MCQLVFYLSISCQLLFFILRILYHTFAAEFKLNQLQNTKFMKKRTAIVVMTFMFCAGLQAQTKTVTLHNDDLVYQGGRYEVPTVDYDDEAVTISADTLINNVTIVIKDADGNIIHRQNTNVTPAETTIALAQYDQQNKFMIEVYYDNKCLYGYFKE